MFRNNVVRAFRYNSLDPRCWNLGYTRFAHRSGVNLWSNALCRCFWKTARIPQEVVVRSLTRSFRRSIVACRSFGSSIRRLLSLQCTIVYSLLGRRNIHDRRLRDRSSVNHRCRIHVTSHLKTRLACVRNKRTVESIIHNTRSNIWVLGQQVVDLSVQFRRNTASIYDRLFRTGSKTIRVVIHLAFNGAISSFTSLKQRQAKLIGYFGYCIRFNHARLIDLRPHQFFCRSDS